MSPENQPAVVEQLQVTAETSVASQDHLLEMSQQEESPECCFVYNTVFYERVTNSVSDDIVVTFTYIPSSQDESPDQNPVAVVTTRINGQPLPFTNVSFQPACDDGALEKIAYTFVVKYAAEQFECPYILETDIELFGVDFNGSFESCDNPDSRRSFRRDLAREFNADPNEPCTVEPYDPSQDDCFDEDGNPIFCDG